MIQRRPGQPTPPPVPRHSPRRGRRAGPSGEPTRVRLSDPQRLWILMELTERGPRGAERSAGEGRNKGSGQARKLDSRDLQTGSFVRTLVMAPLVCPLTLLEPRAVQSILSQMQPPMLAGRGPSPEAILARRVQRCLPARHGSYTTKSLAMRTPARTMKRRTMGTSRAVRPKARWNLPPRSGALETTSSGWAANPHPVAARPGSPRLAWTLPVHLRCAPRAEAARMIVLEVIEVVVSQLARIDHRVLDMRRVAMSISMSFM